ncbi:MAG: hypothetical protein Q8P56_01755 [Candidatus Uhrbacteria bacterium]|nr:hypothetical protein [Candidatus Uhrbacteria bacterium]
MKQPFFFRSKKEKYKKVANNKAGFTVVEVILIVVAVAILIGIIFSALSRA